MTPLKKLDQLAFCCILIGRKFAASNLKGGMKGGGLLSRSKKFFKSEFDRLGESRKEPVHEAVVFTSVK